MTLLSRKTDYALLILWHLHQRGQGACARQIADRFSLSRAFVANILKELCQHGFVASHRGVKGGYTLARPAGEVSLAELIESLDDSFRLAECNNHSTPGDGCSLTAVCPIQGPITTVHRRIRELLGRVTLAELFAPPLEAGPVLVPLLATLGVRGPYADADRSSDDHD